jgi:hypothetical protein
MEEIMLFNPRWPLSNKLSNWQNWFHERLNIQNSHSYCQKTNLAPLLDFKKKLFGKKYFIPKQILNKTSKMIDLLAQNQFEKLH